MTITTAGLRRLPGDGQRHHLAGMTLDLTDEEAAALTRHLRQTIDYTRFPYAPRLDPLKAILAKLEPPKPRPEPLPLLRAGITPSVGQGGDDREVRQVALTLALLTVRRCAI